ncbi:MAG TPA: hypothetical protein VJZ27_20130, partial [Aggregatilineales bacterium]|nr:hypothetical protein [Aggregatilineales bacterium]
MIIDAHAHIIVPEITRDSAPDEAWRPAVSWQDGQQVIDFAGKPIKSAIREFVQIDTILLEQQKAGVDHVLLCPWVSILKYDTTVDDGLRISRIHNDALLKIVQNHPERVSALGSIPLQDPELAARELQALMKSGLRG